MRSFNPDFSVINQAASKEPRYIVGIAFDTARTDVWYLSSDAAAATPIVSAGPVDHLRLDFGMVAAASAYFYVDLNGVTDYVIQTGDVLEYDVYWPADGLVNQVAFDYTTGDAATLRDSGAVDQNGLSAHPSADLSAHTDGNWYSRAIALPSAHVGKTIVNYDLACEYDAGGPVQALVRNIRITDGAGTVRKSIWTAGDDIPGLAPHLDSDPSRNQVLTLSGPTTKILHGILQKPSGTSQRISPEQGNASIGSITIDALDIGLHALIKAKQEAGFGLRGKTVTFHVGYDDLPWEAYELMQTQVIDSVKTSSAGENSFRCSDIQREMRREIFDVKKGFLTASIDEAAGLVPVSDPDVYESVAHGPSFTDAPNQTVGYVRLKAGNRYEVIRWNNKIVDVTLGPCLVVDKRGALDTQPLVHTVDPSAAQDRQPQVEEHIYIELPAVKIALELLGGSLFPAHWTLGIDPAFIKTSEFHNIGRDWYVPTDETQGFPLRFDGLKKTDGKKFIETEIMLLLGAYMRIGPDGTIGLKRGTGVLADAPYVTLIDATNYISHSDLTHDMGAVHNRIQIDWNYRSDLNETTRRNLFIDEASIALHGEAPIKTLTFKGLHGSRHTTEILGQRFDALRDRYAGPPLRLSVEVLPTLNYLEVGDIVRVRIPGLKDYNTDASIDRSMEVQQVAVDWDSGRVRLQLFGSSQKASPISRGGNNIALSDAFYTSEGTDLATVLSITDTGGIGHVTVSGTLTGTADMTAAASIFYYNGDLTIDDGIVVTGLNNIQLRVRGFFQVNGRLDLKGGGPVGQTYAEAAYGPLSRPEPGYYGSTFPAGRGNRTPFEPIIGPKTYGVFSEVSDFDYSLKQGTLPQLYPLYVDYPYIGAPSTPYVDLVNGGATLLGLPQDLRGNAGMAGGGVLYNIAFPVLADGGAGGSGGGGLCVVSRGVGFGVNGVVDTSGTDGGYGAVWVDAGVSPSNTWYAGSGAGGSPGGQLWILDGKNALYPNTRSGDFIADVGDSPLPATPWPHVESWVYDGTTRYWSIVPEGTVGRQLYTHFHGTQGGSALDSAIRVQYVPDGTPAETDIPDTTADVLAINITEFTNSPPTPAENLAQLEVTVTQPAAGNYDYANLYYRVAGSGKPFQKVPGPASPESVVTSAMDGTTYEFEARSVSIAGVESASGPRTTYTVTNQKGGATLAVGNWIAAGKATYLDTVNGWFLGFDGLDPALNLGDAVDYIKWKPGLGLDLSGNVAADSGSIGGWDILPTRLESPNGQILLDAGNNRILVGSETGNNVTMNSAGIVGTDTALGVTFKLPTDGTSPEFSGAIVQNTKIDFSEIGADAVFNGVDAYYNQGFFINRLLARGPDNYGYDSFGSSYFDYGYYVRYIVGTQNGSYVYGWAASQYTEHSLTPWLLRRRFKTIIKIRSSAGSGVANKELWFGSGPISRAPLGDTVVGFGFLIDNGEIFSYAGNGSVATLVTLLTTGITVTLPVEVALEAHFYPGNRVDYFVDGVFKNSITTNVPSLANAYARYWSFFLKNNAVDTENFVVEQREVVFQEYGA